MADRGRLLNDDGEDIYEKYAITERPAGERARDRLAQALFKEVFRNRSLAWLDLRSLSPEDWRVDPFGAALRGFLCERHGAADRPLRVAPAAHHTMGGVRIDASGATSVPGLFAAGEAAGGLHGANRMGGNALSETLVFAARAGRAAAEWAKGADDGDRQLIAKALAESARRWLHGARQAAGLKESLKKIMWEDGGIIREAQGLARALAAVQAIEQEAAGPAAAPASGDLVDRIELCSAARVAGLILEAAAMRRESRGAHFREDFPDQNDADWQGHLKVHQSPGGEKVWRFEPLAAGGGLPPTGDMTPSGHIDERE